MHALFVTVSIQPGHGDEAQAQLETNVVPRVKETPGAMAGYWLGPTPDGHGTSIVLYEDEAAARAAAAALPNAPRPDFVTFDKVEVREVVARF